jgi:predicted transcriptional regulator
MSDEIIKPIYFPLTLVVLKEIDKNPTYTMNLSMKMRITYSHLTRIKTFLIKKGYIIADKKEGRIINIVITEKGKEVVNAFNNLLDKLEIKNVDNYKLYNTRMGEK